MPDLGTQRVALISSSYDPYPGGVEEHTRCVARELSALGHQVEVWTVDRGENLGVRVLEGVVVRYLPTPLPAMSPGGLVRFLRDFPAAWVAWRSSFQGLRPDILHVQCFGPNGVYALLLHHRWRIPLVVSAHGETFMDENDVFSSSRLLRMGLARSLRDAGAVTGCSTMVLDDLRNRFGLRDGVVVSNGVDLDGTDRQCPRADTGTPTIFAVGRLVRVKGFDLLLRAFAQANLPGTRLVIGGDGPELPRLKALVAERGLGSRVVMPGRLNRGQVIQGMAEADLVVVPSRVEAFGIVVLEGWRSGTALVATNHGGPADLVTDGVDGVLVDPEDTAGFGATLSRLMADPGLRRRLGEAGQSAVTQYTWSAVALAYRAIYDRIRSESEASRSQNPR